LKKVDEATSTIITSKWDNLTCGGSHINSKEFLSLDKESFSKNPKFVLRFKPKDDQQLIKYKIVMSRPFDEWKEIYERNKVGSMIGC